MSEKTVICANCHLCAVICIFIMLFFSSIWELPLHFVHGTRLRSYRYIRQADDPEREDLDPEVLCMVQTDYSESVYATNTLMKADALRDAGGNPEQQRRAADNDIPRQAAMNRKFFVISGFLIPFCYL